LAVLEIGRHVDVQSLLRLKLGKKGGLEQKKKLAISRLFVTKGGEGAVKRGEGVGHGRLGRYTYLGKGRGRKVCQSWDNTND